MIKRYTGFFVSALVCVAFSFVFLRRLEQDIRERIRTEVREEIHELVKTEIRKCLLESSEVLSAARSEEGAGSVVASVPAPAVDQKRDQAAVPQRLAFSEKDDAVSEIGHTIRTLIRDELNRYVAGQEESSVALGGGVSKKHLASSEQADLEGLGEGLEVAAGKEKEKAIERTLVQKGGMLLPKGKLQVEPSFSFAHFSSNRINIQGFSILPVIVVGQISTEKVQRDIVISSLSLKYGLAQNLQTEIKVPYRYEFDRVTDNLGAEQTRSKGGLGDVECAVSRQIAWERGMLPDAIVSFSVKPPTGASPYGKDIGLGTGHWAVRGALVAAKSSDPAVIFGNINYTWNIPRTFAEFGRVDPGDTIGYSLGAAIALSYQTAINFQLDHSITSKMKQQGTYVNGSFLNSASFKTGFNWSLSERSSIDVAVAWGLTSDAPDYVIEVRFPYTF